MKSTGSEVWARLLLAATFLVAAVLKAEHALHGGRWAMSEIALLSAPSVIWVVILIEIAVVVALLTRARTVAAYAAMMIAVLGAVLSAYEAAQGTAATCGCLGRIPLTHLQHVLLSLCIIVLAAQATRAAPAGPPAARESATAR